MTRRVAFSCLGALIALSSASSADAQPVVVSNAGQTNMISTVPQPPVSLATRGTCREARTVDEANGAASPCPPGTWPAPGDVTWGPAIESVPGDVLALDFESAPEDVRVTLTSNTPVGLTTPPYPGTDRPGDPVLNRAYGPTVATPSADDPRRWLVVVPNDGRPPSIHQPMYAAITARVDGTGDNYVATLTAGRWVEYGSDCGLRWTDPGPAYRFCAREVVPPGSPPVLTIPGTTPAAKTGPVTRAVRTGRPSARLTGRVLRVVVPGTTPGELRTRVMWKGRPLGAAVRTVRTARSVALRLYLTPLQRRRMRSSGPITLRIVTTVTVPGNEKPAQRTTAVRLKKH